MCAVAVELTDSKIDTEGGSDLRKTESFSDCRSVHNSYAKERVIHTCIYMYIYHNSLFSSSKYMYLCKKFSCKIIFVRIELNEIFLYKSCTLYNYHLENNLIANKLFL